MSEARALSDEFFKQAVASIGRTHNASGFTGTCGPKIWLKRALRGFSVRNGLNLELEQRAPVLMYHHIGPPRPGIFRELTVSPEQFEKQLQWLDSHGYVTIGPSDWLLWLRGCKALPRKPVLLTFDDAYADTAHYALPVLRRYAYRAVVFVVSGRVGRTNTWDEAKGCCTLQLMSAEQIRYWAGLGIEFGAHGRTHADLTKLSVDECSAEVTGSKDDLTAILGFRVVSFAYPYGKYNDVVCDLVESQFELAFGTNDGINDRASDPHLLSRTYIGPDDSLMEFGLRVRRAGLKRFRVWRFLFGICSRLKRAGRSFVSN